MTDEEKYAIDQVIKWGYPECKVIFSEKKDDSTTEIHIRYRNEQGHNRTSTWLVWRENGELCGKW